MAKGKEPLQAAAPPQGTRAKFLDQSRRYLGLPQHLREPARQPARPDLRWLVRYAQHSGFAAGDDQSLANALRLAMGAPAWRLLCRSPKDRFLPILRNRELSLHSLITYCQRLAERSFETAPQALLLEYFVTQRRKFFNLPCRVPEEGDYALMRVADRAGALKMTDIAFVANWVHQRQMDIRPQHKWSSLLRQARAYRTQEQVELAAKEQPRWHFYCHSMPWRGYEIEPIVDSAQLWIEGMAMGTCVYRLRFECQRLKPSRYFSVKKGGKRLATLELAWAPPQEDFTGMDRELGRWSLLDLRLSCNRLPGPHLLAAMQSFAWMFNFWSKRPGRWAADERQDIRLRIERLHGQQLRERSQGLWPDPWQEPRPATPLASAKAPLLAPGG